MSESHKCLMVACLCSLFLLFFKFIFLSQVYATQEYVGRGSYTGTLNENRSTKVGSEVENYVVLHSYDITEASLSNYYYITGTLLNDSYGGVYDITLTIHWKDATGNDLGTERVSTIIGLPAGIRSSFWDIDEDYIPPLEKGYFQGLIEIPKNANVRTITYSTCTEMRADWPKGVNKNGGTYSEAWNDAEKSTYEMNSVNLDRDNDSHACENDG